MSHDQGLHGQNYLLSLGVYHPRVAIDHATPDIELARFVGYADDPSAPLWVRRLPSRKLLRFPQPLHFIGRVLKGMTDIALGPILWVSMRCRYIQVLFLHLPLSQNGPHDELRRERQLCFDNWVRDALAVRLFTGPDHDHTWLKLIVPRLPPLHRRSSLFVAVWPQ